MTGKVTKTSKQWAAILATTYETAKQLRRLHAIRFRHEAFRQQKTVTATLGNLTKRCQCIAVSIMADTGSLIVRFLALMLLDALDLRTLEVFFGDLSGIYRQRKTILLQIFRPLAQWPRLKRLRLHAFVNSDRLLGQPLQTYPSTLRSLESKNIEFNKVEAGIGGSRMSWVSATTFLQQSLDQHDSYIYDNVSNSWDGGWCLKDPGEFSFGQPIENVPQRGSCLKDRVENFTSKGGYFPFSESDDGRFLEAGDITDKLRRLTLRDRRESVHLPGDALWTFCCDRLQ